MGNPSQAHHRDSSDSPGRKAKEFNISRRQAHAVNRIQLGLFEVKVSGLVQCMADPTDRKSVAYRAVHGAGRLMGQGDMAYRGATVLPTPGPERGLVGLDDGSFVPPTEVSYHKKAAKLERLCHTMGIPVRFGGVGVVVGSSQALAQFAAILTKFGQMPPQAYADRDWIVEWFIEDGDGGLAYGPRLRFPGEDLSFIGSVLRRASKLGGFVEDGVSNSAKGDARSRKPPRRPRKVRTKVSRG